jgi:hypothetical protein
MQARYSKTLDLEIVALSVSAPTQHSRTPGFRVEPAFQLAPPQTRTSPIKAYGSSG